MVIIPNPSAIDTIARCLVLVVDGFGVLSKFVACISLDHVL